MCTCPPRVQPPVPPAASRTQFRHLPLTLLQGETSRLLPKPHLSSNHWAFVTGSSVGSLPASSQQAAAGLLERLLLGLDQQLQQTPGTPTKTLFVHTDSRISGHIRRSELAVEGTLPAALLEMPRPRG